MITVDTLKQLIEKGEQLGVEFKSDRNRLFSDTEIYEEVVAFANTPNGGILLIGVEDNRNLTGARARFGKQTDTRKVQAAIYTNTVPNINTRVSVTEIDQQSILIIEVDEYPEPCATTKGRALRRAIGSDGKPQTIPFYPRDQRSRKVDLGLLDFSAQPLDDLTFDSFDPLEFERLRQTVARLRGDASILELSNEDLAKALRLVETRNTQLVPNIAGLLLLAKDAVIQDKLPTHVIHFQVLDAQENVKVNEAFTGSLLKSLQEIETRFLARNEERELALGMFRVPVPNYSAEGFREAVNNAFLHRDYSRLGAIYIQWHFDHLLITNPGGFLEGITLANLLIHEPKPRNPRLAEAFKRIGLVEQTGRGIDKIYVGQLRYGRPIPDYSRSDSDGVRVILDGGEASLQFAAFVHEQEKENQRLFTVDELIVLNTVFKERRIDSELAGQLIQKGTARGRAILEQLHEAGLIEARGEKRARIYHLSKRIYERFGQETGYTRAKGLTASQREQIVIDYVRSTGRITRSEVIELCQLTAVQARYLLKQLTGKYPQLRMQGSGRGVYYAWAETDK
ncbi:MAG: putative DNA binding domain-containing protein [Anaerolineae bacterium]|nr:putative DNA binding domain-containing protein [Anaerolineae bacterium]